MDDSALFISKPKMITLILQEVSLQGDVMNFTFRDKFQNVYTHYQVAPSEAASHSKALKYLRAMTNYEEDIVALDFTDREHILDKFKRHIGQYYWCSCRLRKMDNRKAYRDVDYIVEPHVDIKCFNATISTRVRDCDFERDYIEENRIKAKYSGVRG